MLMHGSAAELMESNQPLQRTRKGRAAELRRSAERITLDEKYLTYHLFDYSDDPKRGMSTNVS